uniref:Uncharacterized protein n=1 Tax=Rhizophora mucronata TaxID=61149 RepID=A0A2P2NQW1_RHIMU
MLTMASVQWELVLTVRSSKSSTSQKASIRHLQAVQH